MSNRLDIIIVNWNAGTLLRDCLESIAATTLVERNVARLVVVDNASTDGSLESLENDYPSIQIVRNERNLGFSTACNQGAENSTGDYLLFLNPDTKVHAASLTGPMEFMDNSENRTIGICGIQLVDKLGRVSRTCCRFPTVASFLYKAIGLDLLLPAVFRGYTMTEWDHARSAMVDHVIGAFYLVRRSVFERLGGFDRNFFVYLEDLDFSLRARKAGYLTYYFSEASAYHAGGGTSSSIKGTRLFYSLRSRIIYAFKNLGIVSATAILVVTMTIEPVSRLVRAISRGSGEEFADTVSGYVLLWGNLPKILAAVSE